MYIEVKIDGTVMKDVPTFKGIKEVIEIDDDLNAWVSRFNDLDVVFWGDAYNYIKEKKKQNGYNYRASVQISISPDNKSLGEGDVVNALIYFTDLQFNHTRKFVKAPLVEVFFEGTIKQNQKAKVQLDQLYHTLNNEVLINSIERVFLKTFDSTDGTYFGTTAYGIELVSMVKAMVGYITDNQVNVQDNFIASTFSPRKFAVVNGYELRNQDQTVKTVESFDNLMDNIFKNFGVWWYMDYSTLVPTLVLDSYNNIIDSTQGIRIDYVKNIEESFNESAFFTSVKIGTTKYMRPPTGDPEFLLFINGYTHHQESYTAKNNTMIDNELNLVSTWISDHNVITDVLLNGNKNYDDDNFIIEYENAGPFTDEAVQFEFANLEADTRRLYNEDLLNVKRLARFRLPIDVGFESGLTDDNFQASMSADYIDTITPATLNVNPWEFDNELIDPNSRYNPATFEYTAGTTEGNYGFRYTLQMAFSPFNAAAPPTAAIEVRMNIFSLHASGTTKASYQKIHIIKNPTGPEGIQLLADTNFYLNTGGRVYCSAVFRTGSIGLDGVTFSTTGAFNQPFTIIGSKSLFETIYVQNQGGLLNQANVKQFHGGILSFENFIPLSTWKSLKKNMTQSITITTGDGRMAETKIKRIEREFITSKADGIELLTKENRVGL